MHGSMKWGRWKINTPPKLNVNILFSKETSTKYVLQEKGIETFQKSLPDGKVKQVFFFDPDGKVRYLANFVD